MRHFEKALFAALMLSSVASARTAVGQALPIETTRMVVPRFEDCTFPSFLGAASPATW